jgi:monothiol glutaredoxin
MTQDTLDQIKQQINASPVLLYMKGTPQFPQCGFSGKVAHILLSMKVNFNYVNILENQDIRSTLPSYAQWPTFPQLWLNGQLVGGCDIVTEMYETNELRTLFEQANLAYDSIIHQL